MPLFLKNNNAKGSVQIYNTIGIGNLDEIPILIGQTQAVVNIIVVMYMILNNFDNGMNA